MPDSNARRRAPRLLANPFVLALAAAPLLGSGHPAAAKGGSSVVSLIRLDEEVYVPGDVPTLTLTTTGFPRRPGFLQQVGAFLCFSPVPRPIQTSPLPPLPLARFRGVTEVQMELDLVTCVAEERFIQGMITDLETGKTLEVTNVVKLRIDKSRCDPNPTGGQGCPPRVWRRVDGVPAFDRYPLPLRPQNLFGDIFEDAFPGETIFEVLRRRPGALEELGRQAVAALLNAEQNRLDFDLNSVQVIETFDRTFPGTDEEYLEVAEFLRAINFQDCPPLGARRAR